MHPLASAWDIAFLGLPRIALLSFAYIDLDEVPSRRSNRGARVPPRVPAIDPQGKSIGTDPDGRPWGAEAAQPRRPPVHVGYL